MIKRKKSYSYNTVTEFVYLKLNQHSFLSHFIDKEYKQDGIWTEIGLMDNILYNADLKSDLELVLKDLTNFLNTELEHIIDIPKNTLEGINVLYVFGHDIKTRIIKKPWYMSDVYMYSFKNLKVKLTYDVLTGMEFPEYKHKKLRKPNSIRAILGSIK